MKEPPARTEFDTLVMTQFEQAVAEQVAAQVKLVEDAAPMKVEKAAAIDSAEAALEVARAAAATAEDVCKQAKEAEAVGDAALKEAKKALTGSHFHSVPMFLGRLPG